LPRSLPKDLDALVSFHPPLPPVFRWMQQSSGLDDTEMLRTFNCGIGMVVIVSSDAKTKAVDMLKSAGDDVEVYELGTIVAGSNKVQMLHSLN
jgi:phosphoribosylaminoimidazole (AIR) synthetase